VFAAAMAAFVSVFVAEFGDKTQLVSLTMACRYPPLQVLGGAMAGLAMVMGLAVGAGGAIAAVVPREAITLASGIFFIFMGLLTLLRREAEREPAECRTGFYQTAAMIFLLSWAIKPDGGAPAKRSFCPPPGRFRRGHGAMF